MVVTNTTGSFPLAVLVAIFATGLLGMIIYRAVYHPILHHPPFVALIASIGLFIAMEESFRIIFGEQGVTYLAPPLQMTLQLGEHFLPITKIIAFFASIVLIGGLGMGYTVRTALNELSGKAQVIVSELVPAVVEWNRGVLAHLAGNPLDDQRVTIQESDVAEIIRAARGDYDAILLDVDNGPQGLVRKNNDWLYGR